MSGHSPRHPGRRKAIAILGVLVLSFGIPLVARAYFRSDASLALLLVPVALSTSAGILRRLVRRWWVDLLAALPPLCFAVLLLVGILITPYSSYAIWIENVQAGAPSGSVSLNFQLALGFFSSVLSPLLLTQGWVFTVAILATAVCAIFTLIFQSTGLTVATLLLGAATLVVLMARSSHRGHRLAAGLFYLAAMSVCLLVGRLFAGSGQPKGSRFVDVTVYPALRQLATDVLPGLPLLYEIPGYGFSFAAKQLGGPTVLSSRGVFTVEGPPGSTAYLRTEVYDEYNGQGWAVTPPAKAATEEERRYMSTFYRRGEMTRDPNDLGVTIQAEYYPRLPTTMDTESLSFPAGVPIVKEGNMNTGIVLSRPIKQGERFTIHRTGPGPVDRPPPWTQPRLSPILRAAYTQIPAELPADVRELAEIINPDVSDKLLVLENIRQFLAIKASYNLRPEEAYMRSGDFVAGFLLSQDPEGYCIHFATSLVILARLAGIPARYATGFLVYIPQDTGMAEVTGLTSHAWPEVWIEDMGWITFEATAAVDPAYYDLYGDALQSRLRINLNRNTAAQIEALLGRHVTAPETVEAEPFTVPPWAATVGLAILGVALVALLALILSGRVKYLFLRDPDRYRFHMRALVRRFERQALPSPDRVGWVKWWDTLEKRSPEHAQPIRQARDSVLRVVYWEGYFQKQHVMELAEFRRRYERVLTTANGNGADGHHALREPAVAARRS